MLTSLNVPQFVTSKHIPDVHMLVSEEEMFKNMRGAGICIEGLVHSQ